MTGLALPRVAPGRASTTGAGVLALAVGTAAVATGADLLLLALATVAIIAAATVLLARPEWLLLVYCASIPFNFALPPGPGGTVARLAGIAFFAGYLLRRPDALRPGILPAAGWLFVGWTLATCLWAADPDVAFETWQTILQLALITVLVGSIVAAEPHRARGALRAYAAAATFTAALGVLSQTAGATLLQARAAAFSDQSPALFASLVVPAVVVLAGEAEAPDARRLSRIAAGAGAVVCAIALALSGTLSAWVGIGAAIAVWLLLRRSTRQVLTIAVAGCAVAILVAAMPGLDAFLAGRAAQSLASGGSGRLDIWAVGMTMFAANPLVGVGIANFPVAFDGYAIAHAPGALAAGGALVPGRGPHNLLLGAAVETGVVGVLLLVAFLGTALLRGGRGRDPGAMLVSVALISLLVQAMFLDILLQKQLWLLVGVGLGLGAASLARQPQAGEVERDGAGVRKPAVAASRAFPGRGP